MRTNYLQFPLLLIVFALLPVQLWAQNLEEIGTAIQSGNAQNVAKYFDTSIEITISSTEHDYSKAQGEMVLKDFFAHNAPSSFSIIHKGSSKQGSQYGIGTLVTNNGKFRTYVYIKQKGNVFYVEELRFEKD